MAVNTLNICSRLTLLSTVNKVCIDYCHKQIIFAIYKLLLLTVDSSMVLEQIFTISYKMLPYFTNQDDSKSGVEVMWLLGCVSSPGCKFSCHDYQELNVYGCAGRNVKPSMIRSSIYKPIIWDICVHFEKFCLHILACGVRIVSPWTAPAVITGNWMSAVTVKTQYLAWVTDGLVVRAVAWNVLSWSGGHECEPQWYRTWGA